MMDVATYNPYQHILQAFYELHECISYPLLR